MLRASRLPISVRSARTARYGVSNETQLRGAFANAVRNVAGRGQQQCERGEYGQSPTRTAAVLCRRLEQGDTTEGAE